MLDVQSAYRANHSTETAVLRVLSDILGALDRGDFAVLTLLDLSAAFDTIDHSTLLRRLKTTYGICGIVIWWFKFKSYLHNRQQSVRCINDSSTPSPLEFGVPQCSVLGLILFLLCSAPILRVVQNRNLHVHLYADDTQVYGFCRPSEVCALQDHVFACMLQRRRGLDEI